MSIWLYRHGLSFFYIDALNSPELPLPFDSFSFPIASPNIAWYRQIPIFKYLYRIKAIREMRDFSRSIGGSLFWAVRWLWHREGRIAPPVQFLFIEPHVRYVISGKIQFYCYFKELRWAIILCAWLNRWYSISWAMLYGLSFTTINDLNDFFYYFLHFFLY